MFGAAVEDDVFYALDECVAGFGLGGSRIDGIAFDFDEGMDNFSSLSLDDWLSPASLDAVSFTADALNTVSLADIGTAQVVLAWVGLLSFKALWKSIFRIQKVLKISYVVNFVIRLYLVY